MSALNDIKRLKDLYKIIRNRYSNYWLIDTFYDQVIHKADNIFIQQLLAIELHVIKLRWGQQPKFEFNESSNVNDNRFRKLEFLSYYRQLRYTYSVSSKFLLPSRQVNVCVNTWSKLPGNTVNARYKGLEDFWENRKTIYQHNDATYQALSDSTYITAWETDKANAIRRREEAKHYLENCFTVNDKLQVICIEIGYLSYPLSNAVEANFQGKEYLGTHYNLFKQWLDQQTNIIGYLQQPFFSLAKGCSVQFTFFLHPQYDELTAAYDIGMAWRNSVNTSFNYNSINAGSGAYYNFNPVIRNYSKRAVGIINKAHYASRNALMYWVIEYFVYLPVYLRIQQGHPLHDIPLLGKRLNLIELPLTQQLEVKLKNCFTFNLTERQLKTLWHPPKIKTKTVKEAKQRLRSEEINNIYQATTYCTLGLAVDFSNFWTLANQIELFMLFIKSGKELLFKDLRILGKINYSKYITQTGRQLFHLFLRLKSDFQQIYNLLVVKNLSINVLVCLEAFRIAYSNTNKLPANIIQDDDIAVFLYDWHRVINQLLAIPVPPAVPDSDENGLSFFEYHIYNHYLVKRIQDLRQTSKKNELLENGAEKPQGKSLNLQQLINLQQDISDRTLSEAESYLKVLFSQDIHVYCFKIYSPISILKPENFSIFSSILTIFLNDYKRQANLPERSGYIGRWEVGIHGNYYAKIILFIPVHQLLGKTTDAYILNIQKLWATIVDQKKRSLSDNTESDFLPSILLDPATIFSIIPEFNHDNCLIAAKNRRLQNKFIKHVLVYMVKQSQYIHHESIIFPKGFFRGQFNKKMIEQRNSKSKNRKIKALNTESMRVANALTAKQDQKIIQGIGSSEYVKTQENNDLIKAGFNAGDSEINKINFQDDTNNQEHSEQVNSQDPKNAEENALNKQGLSRVIIHKKGISYSILIKKKV